MSNDPKDHAAAVLKAAAEYARPALQAFLDEHPERTAELASAPLEVRVSRIFDEHPTVTLSALTRGEVELLGTTALRRLDPGKLN